MYGFVIFSVIVCTVFGEVPYYSPSYSSVLYQRSIQPPYAPSGYRPNEPQFYFPSLRLQQAPSFQTQPEYPRLYQQSGQSPQSDREYPQYPNQRKGEIPQGTHEDPRFQTQPGQQIPFGPMLPRDENTYNTRQASDRPNLIPFPNGRPRTRTPSTTEAQEVTTTDVPSTTIEQELTTKKNGTKEVESLEDLNDSDAPAYSNGQLIRKDELVEQGTYYIYHPSGLLQKVAYNSKNNFAKMDYTAKLKYENVEPIKEPIYTYDPNTYVFSQLTV